MKYIKYFDTLIEANTSGAEGLISPHVDVVGEKGSINYINIGIDKEFNCEYDTDGSAINIVYQPNDEIWYTSSDGQIIEPYEDFGANIVSNTYVDGKGVIKCDGNVTKIGDGTFGGCSSLASINIPDSVTSIGEYTFYGCASLESVIIGDSVTSIGDWAFFECSSLESVIIGNSVTSMGEYTFYGCASLESVIIGNSVTSIGDVAFIECSSLESINIPDSVTSIGERAFNWCTSLTSIIIPDSVTSIGESAFNYCTSLASITCLSVTPPSLGSKVFNNTNDCPIYVPSQSVDTYKTATNWSAYADKIKAIED